MAVPALADIRDNFAFFDDWEDKYRFLIDLGKELDDLPERHRIEENLVRGCQSQVWLVSSYDADADRVHLGIDSDAHIVRGLIAITLACYDARSPAEIVDFDIEALFEELDLVGHLSPSRGNGLRAMVGKVRGIAAAHSRPHPGTFAPSRARGISASVEQPGPGGSCGPGCRRRHPEGEGRRR